MGGSAPVRNAAGGGRGDRPVAGRVARESEAREEDENPRKFFKIFPLFRFFLISLKPPKFHYSHRGK